MARQLRGTDRISFPFVGSLKILRHSESLHNHTLLYFIAHIASKIVRGDRLWLVGPSDHARSRCLMNPCGQPRAEGRQVGLCLLDEHNIGTFAQLPRVTTINVALFLWTLAPILSRSAQCALLPSTCPRLGAFRDLVMSRCISHLRRLFSLCTTFRLFNQIPLFQFTSP